MTFDEWTEDDHPPCQFCDEDVCMCPDEPPICAHRISLGDYCPECEALAQSVLGEAFERKLREIRQREDEEVGAGLAARFEGRGR
jgi:hypothetical protein